MTHNIQGQDIIPIRWNLYLYKNMKDMDQLAFAIGFGNANRGGTSNRVALRTQILAISAHLTLQEFAEHMDRECRKMVKVYERGITGPRRHLVGEPTITLNNAEIDIHSRHLTLGLLAGNQSNSLTFQYHRGYASISDIDRMMEFLLCTTIAERDDDGNQLCVITEDQSPPLASREKEPSKLLLLLLRKLNLSSYYNTLSRLHLDLSLLCSLNAEDLEKALMETLLPFGVRKRLEWAVLHIRTRCDFDELARVRDAAVQIVKPFEETEKTREEIVSTRSFKSDDNENNDDDDDLVICKTLFNCDRDYPILHRVAGFLIGNSYAAKEMVGRHGHFEPVWTEQRNMRAFRKKEYGSPGTPVVSRVGVRPVYDTVIISKEPLDMTRSKIYWALQFAHFSKKTTSRTTYVFFISPSLNIVNTVYLQTNK